MSLTEILAMSLGPTEEEMREQTQHIMKRVRFAFNGEDGDSVTVNNFLDFIDKYGEEINRLREEGVHVSKPVYGELVELAKVMGSFVQTLEQLGSVRLQAQGRRFDDKDGPDYTPPSQDNPQDN